jgi:hypothetical protein
VIVLLLWLYISFFIVLLGAEINAELELQTAKDTTVGRPKPMGQRGAFVADVTPLQQLSGEVLSRDVFLFTPEPKGRRIESGWGNYRLFGYRHVTTPNEPNGVLIDIYRREEGDGPSTLRLTDAAGEEVVHEAGLH